MHRLLFSGDLHIGDSFRTLIQFSNHDVESASLSPGLDVDQVDLQQGFADLKTSVDQDSSLTFRGGRQEMRFGSDRLVDVREGPNIRLSFDGGRAIYQSPDLRVDAFAVKPVVPVPGFDPGGDYFGAHYDQGTSFWGLYGVAPVRAVPGLNDDFYYLGIDRRNVTFDTDTASEERHTLGTRLWGGTGGWDYDTEGAFQFGEFGSRDIRAWTLSSDTGYTLQNVWAKPRLGLAADAASGGGPTGPLKSFDPLFPKFAYFTEAAINAPINFIDVYPSVTIQPTYNFAVMGGVDARAEHLGTKVRPADGRWRTQEQVRHVQGDETAGAGPVEQAHDAGERAGTRHRADDADRRRVSPNLAQTHRNNGQREDRRALWPDRLDALGSADRLARALAKLSAAEIETPPATQLATGWRGAPRPNGATES